MDSSVCCFLLSFDFVAAAAAVIAVVTAIVVVAVVTLCAAMVIYRGKCNKYRTSSRDYSSNVSALCSLGSWYFVFA